VIDVALVERRGDELAFLSSGRSVVTSFPSIVYFSTRFPTMFRYRARGWPSGPPRLGRSRTQEIRPPGSPSRPSGCRRACCRGEAHGIAGRLIALHGELNPVAEVAAHEAQPLVEEVDVVAEVAELIEVGEDLHRLEETADPVHRLAEDRDEVRLHAA